MSTTRYPAVGAGWLMVGRGATTVALGAVGGGLTATLALGAALALGGGTTDGVGSGVTTGPLLLLSWTSAVREHDATAVAASMCCM
jgi:hypothetical protein